MTIEELFDIENWSPASLEYQSKQSEREGSLPLVHYWKNSQKELSPFNLYKLLKAKFGIPNGSGMLFKNDTTDNLLHWHYVFLIDYRELHFFGMSSGIEIILKSDAILSFEKEDWKTLIDCIKKSYSKYGKKMGEIQKGFEKYTLFINPFARLKGTLREHIFALKNLDLEEPPLTDFKHVSEEAGNYSENLNSWIYNVESAASLGTSIRMLCPVVVESFINLLLLVLAKEDFKADKRLYDNLIRQQIDIRVKTLHINCVGFERSIKGNEEPFKSFQSLMNHRNDFLHGNINPTKLMFEDVFFDLNNIPLFKKDDSIIKKTMKNYLQNVESKKAFEDYKTVQTFINFVLEHLKPRERKMIKLLMETRMPGYNNKTKRIGVLFPNALAEINLA
jgi:hypothetical protein